MTMIVPFIFETHAIRTVIVDGRPWWVAADVCRVLDIRNHRDAVSSLDEDEKGVAKADTLGGAQEMIVISESGVVGISSRSNKPVAKRFWRWVRTEVIPALMRDGYYVMPGAEGVFGDRAELEEKRAYYRSLPPVHRDRADARAEALAQIEALVDSGERIGAAVKAVSAETGLSTRSLWAYRRTVYMVPRDDRGAALAPLWSRPKGPRVECHPEALRMFLDLASRPSRITDCYRRMTEEAARRGWSPIPSERTLRRVAAQVVPRLSGPRAA